MKQQHVDYQVLLYPKLRRIIAVMLRSFQHMPMIHGLLEVDVTKARARLREHKAKTGESLSFTAFLIACLAKAVDEHKAVQAYRKGRNQLILFEDVDVNTQIEHELRVVMVSMTPRSSWSRPERTARQRNRWGPRVLPCHESRVQALSWFVLFRHPHLM